MYQSQWIAKKGDVLAIAQRVKIANPEAWNEIKIKGQTSRRYINLVSAECLAAGIPAGVNLKRGGPEESIDVLAFPNESGCGDATGTYAGLELIDIGMNAEGSEEIPPLEPSLTWNDVTQKTIDGGAKGGWKAGSVSGSGSQPPQDCASKFPPRNEPLAALKAFDDDYRRRGRTNRCKDGAEPLHIDNEGISVWYADYLQRRVAGKSHETAVTETLAAIAAAWQ